MTPSRLGRPLTALVLLLIQLHSARGAGVQCYRCTYKRISSRRNRTDPIYPCATFDGHSKYVVDCPKSTMCEMKTTILELPSGETVSTTTRDCADQSVTYRRYTAERGWHEVTDVFEDVYAEGCSLVEHLDAIKVTKTEHCFCSQDRCNGRLRWQLTGGADAVRWPHATTALMLLVVLVGGVFDVR